MYFNLGNITLGIFLDSFVIAPFLRRESLIWAAYVTFMITDVFFFTIMNIGYLLIIIMRYLLL